MIKIDENSLKFIVSHLCRELDANEFVELRLIDPAKKKPAMHGAFNSKEEIISVAKKFNSKMNIYFGLNPRKINSLIEGEKLNQLYHGKAYGAGAISRITHFLIDFDVKIKPESEAMSKLESKTKEVQEFLNKSFGISGALFRSGNGNHILINTKDYDVIETPKKFEALLKELGEFSSNEIQIDGTTFDAARICKLYGTISVKNDEKKISRYLEGNFEKEDLLLKMKSSLERQKNLSRYSNKYAVTISADKSKNLIEIFQDRNLYVKPITDVKHIVICPFNENHSTDTDEQSSTVIFTSPEYGFKCFHNSCKDKTVKDAFIKLGVKREKSIPSYPEQKGFDFKRYSELLQMPEESHEWLVENILLLGGLSIMVGRPKSGKTTLARYLIKCVAEGSQWLEFSTKQGAVLFLALEDKRSQLKEYFQKMNLNEDAPIYVHFTKPPPDPIPQLKEEIFKHKPTLVVIDTLLKFDNISDVNNYSETNQQLSELLYLARETNCHILIIHHQGKGMEGSNDQNSERSVLGSTAISGGVDTILMVTNEKGQRFLSSQQRYGVQIEKKSLSFDAEFSQASLVNFKDYLEGQSRQKILEVIQRGKIDRESLLKEVGMNGQNFTNLLKDLVDKGLIIQAQEGRKHVYELDHGYSSLLGD